jgi:LuxR family maltose regulon positive regulatory protein
LISSAKHLLEFGHESEIQMVIENGNIFLGMAHYYQNEDKKALAYLLKANELRHFTYLHMSFATGMALADLYAKSGNYSAMDTLIRDYETTALKQGGNLFIRMTKSATAKLNWKYRNDLSGLKWAKENNFRDFLPFANLYSPELVQASILAMDDDPSSHSMAQDIVNNTIPYFENRNDDNVLIRALAIQAVLFEKSGDTEKAMEALQKVINLSSPGRYIRPFLELGESMKSLLLTYKLTAKNEVLVDEILKYYKGNEIPDGKVILTGREKEILSLSEQMTNKELANHLFISEKTVKTHITNIYKKLKATSKPEAIAKANEIGQS